MKNNEKTMNNRQFSAYLKNKIERWDDGSIYLIKNGALYPNIKSVAEELGFYFSDKDQMWHLIGNRGKIKGIIDDYENEIDAIYSMEIKYFGTGKKNSPIVKVLEKDKLDHKVVIELMRANDWQGAYNKWGDMDTESRDRITKEAYNLMMEKNDFPNKTLKDGGNIGSILDDYKNHINQTYFHLINHFKNSKREKEVHLKDLSDHESVIQYMKDGSWEDAYSKWYSMDTASRENITNDAYVLLMGKNGYPTYRKGGTVKGFKYTIGGL